MKVTTLNTYGLDELRFYVVDLELHSIAWFSSIAQPNREGFVQVTFPVIHNYPLILAFIGQIAEESYIAAYSEFKITKSPAWRFNDIKIYAYPLVLGKTYYRKMLMSMSETDFVFYKPRTRLIVPTLTYYNVLAPGTMGSTVVITAEGFPLPKNLYIRIGVKRYGIWRSLNVTEVRPVVRRGVIELNTPFNVSDVHSEDILKYSVGLKHYAGDLAISGTAKRALEFPASRGEVGLRPIPLFISI